MDPSTSAAALKLEIARLKGSFLDPDCDPLFAYGPSLGMINQHKTSEQPPARPTGHPVSRPPRSNVYVNPNYKPPSKSTTPVPSTVHPPRLPVPSSSQKRDVVIGGVAFESSGRSLVRKDCMLKPSSLSIILYAGSNIPWPVNKPSSVGDSKPPRRPVPPITLARNKAGTLVNPNRTYKPKVSRGRARNMTLNNSHRPYQFVAGVEHRQAQPYPFRRGRRVSSKRKVNKPCARFTTTGTSRCSDPSDILQT